MKRNLLLLFLFFLQFSSLHAQQMSDLFVALPDSILPLLTERNRRDMVDFLANKMEARLRNRMDEYAKLDTLTDDYLHLTLSESSMVEMKRLVAADTTSLICLIRTVGNPHRDSQVEFYDTLWHRLPWLSMPRPEAAAFVSGDVPFVVRALADLPLIEVSASPDSPYFTQKISLFPLSSDDRKVAEGHIHPLRYRWNGNEMERLP